MDKSLKSISIKYGLYLAILFSTQTIVAYIINIKLFVNEIFGISIYVIAIAFGIFAIYQTKKVLKYLSFKESFTAYFITILIGLSTITLVSFIIFNFIDTNAAIILREKSIEKLIEVYKSIHMDPEKINEKITQLETENLFSLKNSIISLAINYLLPLIVIGLLISVVMKKTDPNSQ